MTEEFCMAVDEAAGYREGNTEEKSLFLLTDRNVATYVLPLLEGSEAVRHAERLIIDPGEESKSPATLIRIWEWLSEKGATRKSLMINLGGGMITDLGGFAAATFKRGMEFVNIPTTLLGAVDAASGGKTGCNLGGLKNEVGVFAPPADVVISSLPFATLPRQELLSGMGEMLKTGLIASAPLYRRMLRPSDFLENPVVLEPLVKDCVAIKTRITRQDPREAGLRKILNFGHTAGHALESLMLRRGEPVPHGIAVAHGLLVEMILSHMLLGFPSRELYPMAELLKDYFLGVRFSCKDTGTLLELMSHDKKNPDRKRISVTLLKDIGQPEWDHFPDTEEIATALDIYRDLTAM